MSTEPLREGTLWGVSWQVFPACVTCSAIVDGELMRRRYVDYGVREAVREFLSAVTA